MSGCNFIEVPTNQFVNIPLPPVQGGGVVKFGRVYISVSHVVSGTTSGPVEVGFTVYTTSGKVRVQNTVSVGLGRTVLVEAVPGDGVVVVSASAANTGASLSVLVEYETPGDPGALT